MDLDRRIAEAAAAVEALRRESSQLDRELQQRSATGSTSIALVCEPDTFAGPEQDRDTGAAVPQQVSHSTPIAQERPSSVCSAQSKCEVGQLARSSPGADCQQEGREATCVTEGESIAATAMGRVEQNDDGDRLFELRGCTAQTCELSREAHLFEHDQSAQVVKNSAVVAPAQLEEHDRIQSPVLDVTVSPLHGHTFNLESPTVVVPAQLNNTPLGVESLSSEDVRMSLQHAPVENEIAARKESASTPDGLHDQTETRILAPVPPAAPGSQRPPRPVPACRVRRDLNGTAACREQAIKFPSDAAFASMSRRQRIELLERENSEVGEEETQSRGSPNLGVNGSLAPPYVEIQARAARDQLREGRRRHTQDADQSRALVDVLPTNRDLSQMSRRERIALLEKAQTCDPDEQGLAAHRDDSGSMATRRGSRALARRRDEIGVSPARAPEENIEDEAWLEQRRQNRKQRLQRAPRVPSTQADSAQPILIGGRRRASESRERCAKPEAGDGARGGAACASSPAGDACSESAGAVNLRNVLEQLEEFTRLGSVDSRICAVYAKLTAAAYQMSPGDLVRALKALSSTSASVAGNDSIALSEQRANAFHASAESLLAAVMPHFNSLGAEAVADSLQVMVLARITEQTHLDMLLAHLLVLFRRERETITLPLLARVASALGSLHVAGVSAKRGASGPSSTANRRCIEALGERLAGLLPDIGPSEVALLGGPYVVNFLDDVQRRALLRRAAELEVGLSEQSRCHLSAIREMEFALRQHSFAFIASLPDKSKDYLIRVKASEKPEPGG